MTIARKQKVVGTYSRQRNAHVATATTNIDDFSAFNLVPRITLLQGVKMSLNCHSISSRAKRRFEQAHTSGHSSHRACETSSSLWVPLVELKEISSVARDKSILLSITLSRVETNAL